MGHPVYHLIIINIFGHFSIMSTTNSPSPHHISLFSGGNVALQNGANSMGNLYNNPIATEAQYMQQQGPN